MSQSAGKPYVPQLVSLDPVEQVVVRVPIYAIHMPNPKGTSVTKYEPDYVIPMLLDLWKPRIGNDATLKPIKSPVPAFLVQHRYIDSVEGERGRLEQVYGLMRGSDELTRATAYLPGDRLWSEIKKIGVYVTLRTEGHHTFEVPGSERPIPADATPFDVLNSPVLVEDDEEIETEASLKAAADAEKRAAAKVAMAAVKADAKRRKAEAAAKIKAEQEQEQTQEEDDEVPAK